MRNFTATDDRPISSPLSPAARISYLLTFDNRRQQALVELQAFLKQQSSDLQDQEPTLTKEKFNQVFSKRVRHSNIQFFLTLDFVLFNLIYSNHVIFNLEGSVESAISATRSSSRG